MALGLFAGVVLALAIAGLSSLLSEEPTAAEQAREVIEDKYFREVDPSLLEGSSVRGMVGELRKRYDDRFSHYFDPKQLEELNAATSGEFSGVGLTVSEVKRGLRVASVLENTPAQGRRDQGGRPDRRPSTARTSPARPPRSSSARIKGPPGTEVELRVVPVDGGEPRDIEVERAEVRVPAVDGKIIRDRHARRATQGRVRPASRPSPRARTGSCARRSSASTARAPRACCSTCAATAADC